MSVTRLLLLWLVAVPAFGAADEPRFIAELVERSPLIAIGTVTNSETYGGGRFQLYHVDVHHTPQGAANTLTILEQLKGRDPLLQTGERRLFFLRPAPTQSLIRSALPQGDHQELVGGPLGAAAVSAEQDEAAIALIRQAASSNLQRDIWIRAELRSGISRFVEDALQLLAGVELEAEDWNLLGVALKNVKLDEETRAQLLRFLGQTGKSEAKTLVQHYRPAGSKLAAARIEALANLGSPPTLRDAALLLSDPEPDVRRIAVDQLGSLEDDSAVGQLESVAETDRDRGVRLAAVRALGRQRGPDALAALERTFVSDDGEVATATAEVLLAKKTPEVRQTLGTIVMNAASYESQARALFLMFAQGATKDDPDVKRIAKSHPDPKIRKIILKGIETDPHHHVEE